MRPSLLLGLASCGAALNILLNNDDGFGSSNIRELYRLLREDGHDAWIVAPATQQSGMGGKSDFSTEANLTAAAQYDIVPKGAPSLGQDPNDSHIWYYNGTPAACTFVALDHVLPLNAKFKVPDLVVTGPNYGTNLGPFVWTLAGTAGAAYAATERSIPAIAFSGSNKAGSYKDVKNATDPATLVAKLAVKIVNGVVNSTAKGGPLLPLGYGLNVNFPPLTNGTDPKIVQTRMTGNAQVNEAVYNATQGIFTWANIKPYAAGVNACNSGDCSLPGETYVVENGGVSMSLYITDYSAPESEYTDSVMKRLKPLTED